jgi:hypothetical protein
MILSGGLFAVAVALVVKALLASQRERRKERRYADLVRRSLQQFGKLAAFAGAPEAADPTPLAPMIPRSREIGRAGWGRA